MMKPIDEVKEVTYTLYKVIERITELRNSICENKPVIPTTPTDQARIEILVALDQVRDQVSASWRQSKDIAEALDKLDPPESVSRHKIVPSDPPIEGDFYVGSTGLLARHGRRT